MNLMSPRDAVAQLRRSERGVQAAKMLHEFLRSPTVSGLDSKNCLAIASIAAMFMLGSGSDSCAVRDALSARFPIK